MSIIENKEVSWKVLDIPIYGTVTVPKDNKTLHPAVILVAGSGPTDRNWCSPLLPGTNGSAKLLAEALSRQGFITLRYDKMASGPHVKESVPKFTGKISMQTHVEELAGAVETAIFEDGVDKDNIFALTNSEGAIHVVNYQLQTKNNRFKGLVLTGAPGRSIGDIARAQIYSQARALSNAETLMKHYDEAIAEFLAARPIVIDQSLPESMGPFLHALENPTNLPFSRELWNYDLSEYIAKMTVPILIVIGKKDIQIDWQVDGKALERAVPGNAAVSFFYPENANHVLKHEEKPREKLTAEYVSLQYNSPVSELDRETTDTIIAWLEQQTKKSELAAA